jgi:3-oxoadipate enol-lactonase
MFVRANSLSVHVQIRGPVHAPALVLLHSIGTNLHLWDAQAEALADRYRVVQPDLRGHGLSSVPAGPYSMAQMAQDIEALLSALSIAQAHVAGVSMGGAVAMALAASSPRRVLSLILCDTAPSFAPAAFWEGRARAVRADGLEWLVEPALERWVSEGFRQGVEADGMRAMLRRTDPQGYAASAQALASCNLEGVATGLRMPTLVLVGENDLSTPVATARALCDSIPGAVLKLLPARAHIPQMEAPDHLNRLMGEFLDGTAPRKPDVSSKDLT